jgi:ATP-binding cassette subfamily F protein uup
MARSALLQLTGVSLTFGGDPIFDDLGLVVQEGDRAALVGRNGSGKSTLMKVMAGLVLPDQGARSVPGGTSVGYLHQEPDFSPYSSLGEYALADLGPENSYLIERSAEGLKLALDTHPDKASGGEKRRAALARLLAEDPDLMLLDEPTNHLDIDAIRWLEGKLQSTRKAFITISHDRAFLNRLTRQTLWIDRSVVRRQDRGFDRFEEWRDKIWANEDISRHKLDRKIKDEGRWAVEGISARRKRNMGRVRALADLRQSRSDMIRRQGTADFNLGGGPKSGRKVLEATGLNKSFGDLPIISNFDLRVLRGDRIAFVGPNGSGKTTLLKMLLGEIAPDTGTVTHGTNLDVAVFDQSRAQLDQAASLWDNLTLDKHMAVQGRSDQVMVRGEPRHVIGYLKDFLFSEDQARAPVRSLSGGEKARLLLAKLMAQPSNLLVLDEPTNDLDIESLDLLQDILGDYPGTVLLVSHDRDFIDRVATSTIVLEGQGRSTVYAGGYSDYLVQAGPQKSGGSEKAKKEQSAATAPQKSKTKPSLTFTEQHRLGALPGEIDRLNGELVALEKLLADPALFSTAPHKFAKASTAIAERQGAIAKAEEEWMALAERAESD